MRSRSECATCGGKGYYYTPTGGSPYHGKTRPGWHHRQNYLDNAHTFKLAVGTPEEQDQMVRELYPEGWLKAPEGMSAPDLDRWYGDADEGESPEDRF